MFIDLLPTQNLEVVILIMLTFNLRAKALHLIPQTFYPFLSEEKISLSIQLQISIRPWKICM